MNLESSGFYQPAEWQPHSACWLAFPADRQEWGEHLEAAQAEFIALARVIARSEKLEILVRDREIEAIASQAFANLPVRLHAIPYGDIWLRDTAPIFVLSQQGELAAQVFNWNGWGHKYLMPGDEVVSRAIAKFLDLPTQAFPLILEGGAIEVDGEGTCLTTRQCLCDRNPELSETQISQIICQAYGVKKVLWLEQGLRNDHTDGHIDTIARFVAPNQVMHAIPSGSNDPNARVLDEIAQQLSGFQDAQGRNLELIPIPSPGLVLDRQGEIMPASYLNFYIANNQVIVPTYGTEHDRAALEAIAPHFPTRQTLGLPAKNILVGGGAFHCITQQQPLKLAPENFH
jgi:agmatine deiminase